MKQSLLFVCVTSLVLSACGGGGGGGESGSNPLPAEPDTSKGTLLFSEEDDSFSALPYSLAVAETLLQSAQFGLNRIAKFAQSSGGLEVDCANTGGQLSIGFDDKDLDLQVSAGDTVQLQFRDCYEPFLDAEVDGLWQIDLEALNISSEVVRLSGRVSYEEGLQIVDLGGDDALEGVLFASFSVSYQRSINPDDVLNPRESLEVLAEDGDVFGIDLQGNRETLNNFFVSKAMDRGEIGASFSFFVDSPTLGGSFSCATENFRSQVNEVFLQCEGVDGNAVRTLGVRQFIQIDRTGSGQFVDTELGILSFFDILDGYLFDFRAAISLPRDSGELLANGRIFLSANDMLYNPTTQRVLISDAGGASAGRLLALNPDTHEITTLLELEQVPNLLRLSRDRQRLYVSFVDSAVVQQYDLSDFSLLSRAEFRGANVEDLAESPRNPQEIAAVVSGSVAGQGDVQLLVNGQVLAETYLSLLSSRPSNQPGNLAYSADGLSIIVTRSTGGTGQTAERLQHNGDTLVSLSEPYSTGLGGAMQTIGERVYTGAAVFDERSMTPLGHWESLRKTTVSETDQRIYTASGRELYSYRLDTQSRVSELALEAGDPLQLLSTPDELLIREQSLIRVIQKTDITITADSECSPESLENASGLRFQQLRCDVDTALYDAGRHKIYLSVGGDKGEKGNSLWLVNADTLMPEAVIPAAAQPTRLALSANGRFLYAIFHRSHALGRIDLEAQNPQMQFIPLPLGRFQSTWPVYKLAASSVEPDAVVVAWRAWEEAMRAVINGEVLAGIASGQVEGSLSSHWDFGFDDAGLLYTYSGDKGVPAQVLIDVWHLDSNGIAAMPKLGVMGAPFSAGLDMPIAVGNGVLIDGEGRGFDLSSGVVSEAFDAALVEGSSPWPEALALSVDRDAIYYLSSSGRLMRFDVATRELLGVFQFPETLVSNFAHTDMQGVPGGVVVSSSASRTVYLVSDSEFAEQ